MSPPPSLTGQVKTHDIQSVDKRLENGEHILIEFGRAKTPVYIFFCDIPLGAKLLVDLNKLPPLKRRVALPDVAKFMWDKYLNWKATVEETATTYTWGQIFLLAHTTKVLLDDTAHRKSLDALLAKGESVNYQMEAMFNVSEWNLVRFTVKAGESRDDATRETISRLFKGCPELIDYMILDHGVRTQELHDIGLEYGDTYELRYLPSDDPNVNVMDMTSISNRRPLPVVGPSTTADLSVNGSPTHGATDPTELQLVKYNNEVDMDVDETALLPAYEQAVDPGEGVAEVSEHEPQGSLGKAPGDEWEIVSISSLGSYDNDFDEEDPVDNEPTGEAGNEQTATDVPNQPAEDLANQLAGLVVQEGVAVDDPEEHAGSQAEDSVSNEGGTALEQEELTVDQQANSTAVASSEDISDPGETVSSQMMAVLAKIPGLKSSKWASDMAMKLPVSLDAETKTALTEFINAPTNIPDSDFGDEDHHDVIGSATTEVEQNATATSENEQPYLSSGSRSPVDLQPTASDTRSDAEEPANAEDSPGVEETSEAEDTPDAEVASDGQNDPDAETADYTDGFVPRHNLPRTAPASPVKPVRSYAMKEPPFFFEERRKGQKRGANEVEDASDILSAKHARHKGEFGERFTPHPRADGKIKAPKKKYGKSALHALREKQAASAAAPEDATKREEPTRQPKGPPASGKEMADDKAKDPEAWPENFGLGAPPRPDGRLEKRMAFSPGKGVHFVDGGVDGDGDGVD
ncbi:hypothetical protein P171DRAFT_32256 [Karstenula rhodostoma CBS 690.94]|uniref:Uncharacterized protein n=1 Tax=Karstenula rhodostoma CBS 690.94 TaxID=1392251 RepID=A0A9P4PJF7_9PLEO|nr:hypothetical protein P171DRAFT_32256 [Karstenula rhodostoma CBS 690.94]